MDDLTDDIRRTLIERGIPQESLDAVIATGGKTWDTDELRQDFKVLGFAAPFTVVERRADRVRGSLMFTHHPRFYFDFQAD